MKFLHISLPLRMLFLGLIVCTSLVYAYLADYSASNNPEELSFFSQVFSHPTSETTVIMLRRVKEDILVFICSFLIQASGLVGVYLAGCVWITIYPINKGGKDL